MSKECVVAHRLVYEGNIIGFRMRFLDYNGNVVCYDFPVDMARLFLNRISGMVKVNVVGSLEVSIYDSCYVVDRGEDVVGVYSEGEVSELVSRYFS